MEWTTTSTILQGLADHDNRGAWERFVSRFHAPVIGFARERGLAEPDAEDVAQETLMAFAAALRSGKYQRSKGRLSQYLFGIAHRQALNRRRRNARRLTRGPGAADATIAAPHADDDVEAVWEREWEHNVLEHCLRQVRRETSDSTYRAFELVVRDQVAPAAAAEAMNIPIKAVYNAKHRVLQRIRQLREELEEME